METRVAGPDPWRGLWPPKVAVLGAILACASVAEACAPEGVVGITTEFPVDIALYETFELTIRGRAASRQPFSEFAQARFRLNDEVVLVDGFYDGNSTWKVRFSPELAGRWEFEWELGKQKGGGVLHVGTAPWTSFSGGRSFRHHGHVHSQGQNRVALVHSDGSAHYWMGAKWISAKNYGPERKHGQENDRVEDGSRHDAHYSDATFYEFLDLAVEYGLNGMLLKLGLFPLEDNGWDWDLGWLRRADAWVSAMNERGVYCQITLFEPWSRRRSSPFEYSLTSTEHVLDAWSTDPEQRAKKENYVRYAVARFAGYANVYWELANQANHPRFDTMSFLGEARDHYVPWLERYDPYGVAIALSDIEQARTIDGIDIEAPRHNTHLPAPPESRKARMVNELVHDCGLVRTGARAYLDATIREESYRSCYRAANWIAFVSGAYGGAAASWLDLTRPLDPSVHDVLRDLGRMKAFIDELPVRHDELLPDDSHMISSGDRYQGTRSRRGRLYVSYFQGPMPPGKITVELPAGIYDVRWIDPASFEVLSEGELTLRHVTRPQAVTLERPAIGEDAVLVLHNQVIVVIR